MGEEAEAGCSFSLICQEDGTDLFGSFANDERDGELLLLYSDAEEDDAEEYMDHLMSKETSFCCSPSSSSSSSSPAISDAGAESAMASEDWFLAARRATVKWILEMRAYFGFFHRTAYLAVTYFDRFCLHRCFDRSVMPWAARLLAVACVSVAAKMEEYRAPALSEFRADGEYDFSCVSIRRVELLVLSTLGWRLGDVTPFDYLPCLASRLRRGNGGGGGGSGLVAAKAAVLPFSPAQAASVLDSLSSPKAAALIFSTAEAASVLNYRSSTVAAAAVLAATHGALTRDALESKMSNFSPSCLLEDDVYACYSLMLSRSSMANKPAKRPPSCSEPVDAASTYHSAVVADDAASFEAASSNKRMRLELPGIRR